MPIIGRRVLVSAELLLCAGCIHVKWEDQLVDTDNSDEVVSRVPHRTAYILGDVQFETDPAKQRDIFAAVETLTQHVEQFEQRLADETTARTAAEAACAQAAEVLKGADATIVELQAALEQRSTDEANQRARADAAEQKLREEKATTARLAASNAAFAEKNAQAAQNLAGAREIIAQQTKRLDDAGL